MKKNNVLVMVMALVFLTLGLSPAYSQNAPNSEDDFDITQNAKGTISIKGYKGKRTQVIIPETIEGIKVTEIGSKAFNENKNITSVTIPASVTSIGDWAFQNCTSLTSLTNVTIPNSVTSLGDGAFEYCNSLTIITIPNGVTGIGDYAFFNCSSLASVTIGANKNYAGEFPNNFSAYYDSQGKKAGTYTWSGRLWSVK